MGVRGLSTFIEAHPHLTMPHKLHDCTVVVDGNNLLHFLYSFYEINCVFGGDYITYASKVSAYFSAFKKCNIKPIVILDGGNDKSDRFLPTQMERWKKGLLRVKQASETGKSQNEESFLPINISEVFKNTLLKLGIPFLQCEYESDGHIAALANHFNCPVLSDDGDFYIFDLKNGYIRISSLGECKVLISEDDQTKYLKCKIYHINKFLSFYPSIDKNIIPLLASLAGNDYMKYEDLKPLSYYVHPQKGQRIEQILSYLSNRDYHEAVGEIMSFIYTENQEEFKKLLDFSVNSYKIKVSNLSYLFGINNTLSETKILTNSKLVTPCGMPFPKEYVHKHNQGHLPADLINVMNLHRLFLCTQVGDLVDRSSYNCSCFVRQVIYGILFQHETATENLKNHKLLCLRDVDEYDVDKGFEVYFKTKPLFVLPRGKLVPQLHEIKFMNETTRLDFLTEVMGIKTSYLQTIPENLQLLFGIIIYWLQNCSPKPSKEFVIALLLCIAHFNVLHESILTNSTSQDEIDYDISKMCSFLNNITTDSNLKSTKNSEKFTSDPAISCQHYFDVDVIRNYNQLQTCLKYLKSLNKLLASPLKSPNSGELFEGSVLCCLTKALQSNHETGIFVELFLGKETASQNIFNILLKSLLQNILPGFPWSKTPNWNREKSSLYHKLGF